MNRKRPQDHRGYTVCYIAILHTVLETLESAICGLYSLYISTRTGVSGIYRTY